MFIVARNLGFGNRVTDYEPGSSRVKAVTRKRAASGALNPVAKATRKTARGRRSVKEGESWNLLECSKIGASRDQQGERGVDGP